MNLEVLALSFNPPRVVDKLQVVNPGVRPLVALGLGELSTEEGDEVKRHVPVDLGVSKFKVAELKLAG